MARRSAREIPPPLELECLNVLWRLGESSVRAVRAELIAARPLAYTTVMTMLERLARKQFVTRRKTGRHFLYTPAIDRDTVREHAVRHLVSSLFDGSPHALAAYLRGEVLDGAPRMRAAAANAAAPAVVHDSAADDALGALDTALL